jgi:predicted nucleic acid-binding protein
VRVVLDTDVASGLIRPRLPSSLCRKLLRQQLALTFVTVGELTKWVHVRGLGQRRRGEIDEWLGRRPMIAATAAVARKWGEIVAHAEKRGRSLPVNDSWIAACCLVYDLPLATRNVADFEDLVEYERLTLVSAD